MWEPGENLDCGGAAGFRADGPMNCACGARADHNGNQNVGKLTALSPSAAMYSLYNRKSSQVCEPKSLTGFHWDRVMAMQAGWSLLQTVVLDRDQRAVILRFVGRLESSHRIKNLSDILIVRNRA